MAKSVSQLTKVISIVLASLFLLATTIYFVAKWIFYPFKQPLHAHKVFDCDITSASKGDLWWTLAVGPDADPFVLTSNVQTTTDTKANLNRISNQCAAGTIKCTIYHMVGNHLEQLQITDVPGPFLTIQPCGKSEYLIASATSFSPEGGFNGFIYDASGKIVRKLQLGIDLNQLQCDADGNLWVTYDTTKYRNAPINTGGLVCMDTQGKILYRFNTKEKRKEAPSVLYGLALNVAADHKVSVCPNRLGGIIKLANGSVDRVMSYGPASGCLAMAVSDNSILFDKCDMAENRMMFADMEHNKSFYVSPVDDSGNVIELEQRGFVARGSRLYFTNKKAVYFVDIADIKP